MFYQFLLRLKLGLPLYKFCCLAQYYNTSKNCLVPVEVRKYYFLVYSLSPFLDAISSKIGLNLKVQEEREDVRFLSRLQNLDVVDILFIWLLICKVHLQIFFVLTHFFNFLKIYLILFYSESEFNSLALGIKCTWKRK